MQEAFRAMEDADGKAQIMHDELVEEISCALGFDKSVIDYALYRASIGSVNPLHVAHIVYDFLAHVKEKNDGRAHAEQEVKK